MNRLRGRFVGVTMGVVVAAIALASCQSTTPAPATRQSATPTAQVRQVTPIPTRTPTATTTDTATPQPTHTPTPTLTPTETATPQQTYTPPPSPTSTFTPTPTNTPELELILEKTPTPTLVPTETATPEPYYTQFSYAGGITIKATDKVDPAALDAAADIIEMMLSGRQDIVDCMANYGTEMAIIPKDEYVTTLPDFFFLKSKKTSDGRLYDDFIIRGLGGTRAVPTTAAAEENLLKLAGDPFWAEDITIHEFAHTIRNLCFTQEDHNRWDGIYNAAKQANVFPGHYAMTNSDEFFAELTQSYFNVNFGIGGPDVIEATVPNAFTFLVDAYGSLS